MRLEDGIQQAIVDYLALVTPETLVWAVPNAARRSKGGKAGNAVPGLRKGVHDLSLLFKDGRFATIEVKTATGVLSDEQADFGDEVVRRKAYWCIARSVDDARKFLARLSVKTREVV